MPACQGSLTPGSAKYEKVSDLRSKTAACVHSQTQAAVFLMESFDQPKDLLHGIGHILAGLPGIHGFFQTGHGAEERKEGIDPGLVAGRSI